MFIHYCWKNKYYKISKRDYTCDYSKFESQKIDMTLSGRYLSKYPNIRIPISHFDKYPLSIHIKDLENLIKSKITTNGEIIIGSGANGILQNIVKILFKQKGNLITSFYSFDQVEYAVTSFGGKTKRVYTDGYNLDLNRLVKLIDKKTRMVYISNPNNPTGQFINSYDLIELAKKIDVPLIVDESGIEFTNQMGILESADKLPENLLVVRSFSKAYGLANLRIGYLLCSNEFKKVYLKNTTTNEYSGISCIIANRIMKESSKYMKDNVTQILKEKQLMIEELNKLGIEILNGSSNTIFTKTYFDKRFLKELENNNVSVVPIYDKNDRLHIRIAIQDFDMNKRFISKMKKIFKDKQLILGVEENC